MSEKTQKNSENIGFDFQKEVERVFFDFPYLQNTTLFLTTADHPYYDSPLKLHGSEKLKAMVRESYELPEAIHRELKKAKRSKNSFLDDYREEKLKVITISHIDKQSELFGKAYEDFVQEISLDHELGHLLVPHAMGERQVFNECAADAFAAIRSLQRNSNNRAALALHSSWRAFESMNNGYWAYLTTPVVDKIIADSYSIDFKNLTPQETVRMAGNYAKLYMPAPKNFYELKEDFTNKNKNITTVLAAAHKYSFYIGARAFQPLLSDQGMTLNGLQIKLPNRFKAAVMSKAKELGIDDALAVFEQNKQEISNNNKAVWIVKTGSEGGCHAAKPKF